MSGDTPRPPAASSLIEVTAPPAARDIRDATLIKEGDVFLLADLEGNVRAGNPNGFGLYLRDTRFLNAHELVIQGLHPTILLSSGRWHFLGAQVLTNPNLVTADGKAIHEQTVQIRRYRVIRGTALSESLTFQNFNAFPLALDVVVHLDADFADVFAVRGLVPHPCRGRLHLPEHGPSTLIFVYDGCDAIRRTTRVSFDPPPGVLAERCARYRLELDARGAERVAMTIELEEKRPVASEVSRPARPPTPRVTGRDGTTVRTGNGAFDAMLERVNADLRVLAGGDAELPFLAAGIPWYAALFGRDSLITALEMLWMEPSVACRTLLGLARSQAAVDDAWRDEEPGKILHEHRRGELANVGAVPFAPYYGTVDATPLWIWLLSEYCRTTGDLELARALRPNLEAALAWMDRYGDKDGDGFLEYERRSPSGLLNQGWKDSWDGIPHASGALAEPPIALVEVQGYAYAAKRGAAQLLRALGEPDRARTLDEQASRLYGAFNDAFWMEAEGFYCLALDGRKRQVAAVGSNPGHALACGIVPPERAARVAERFVREDMFSGWGIRTLSSREAAYNPVGYHLGTVWPHDNALVALGLKRCGHEAYALAIFTALYDAAQHFPSQRLPELFCGFARSAFGVPVRYPVACSPQAWASASWLLLLQVALGIVPVAETGELRVVRPHLPPWLPWVEVTRIRVGATEVDLRYQRIDDHTAVDVKAMRGDVRVTFVDTW